MSLDLNLDLEINIHDAYDLSKRKPHRPQPLKPSRSVYIAIQTDKLAKKIIKSPLNIILSLAILLISIYFSYLNIFIKQELLHKSQIRAEHLSQLQVQLDELKGQWSEEELKDIEKSMVKAQATVLDDYPALSSWLRTKTTLAKSLGFKMSYRLKQQETTELEQTFSIPLEMTLKVLSGVTDKVYSRALTFIRSLVDENLHLEITGNELISDGKSIQQIKLNVNVWIRDADAMANVQDLYADEVYEDDADDPFVQ